jgi:hypothetical protein
MEVSLYRPINMPTSAEGIENTNDRRNELIKLLFGELWRRRTSLVFASYSRQFRSTTIFRVENRQDGGISLAVVGDSYRTVISGKDTGGAYAVIEMLIPPGGGPGPHAHAGFEETFRVCSACSDDPGAAKGIERYC